uniref:NADH-ubiquinone oxidoreductase chain 3 n=1 Tax=Nemertopsis tetraclitophila TaxID=1417004 RepID=A0A075CG96_9BILA|nr:NADH dehydrogenase subunit 3 [Nemertopsis tetraclitophila]AGZ63914.1 NADH dehydrogenase subunit 3 [Nemertopsis tetraclitophila]
MFFCIFVSLFFSFLFWILSYYFGKRSVFSNEKNSPFECGFDPSLSARIPFSMRFFLLAVLFLIFDVEIVLLLPLPLVLNISFWEISLLMGVLFIFVLLLGLFHEWREGSLNWVY